MINFIQSIQFFAIHIAHNYKLRLDIDEQVSYNIK